ncbi:lasso peptide biosynthesis B2 protein [Fredinandcohnia sp. 179-A 10B2 NHS]|uniref:lasso peptide biosynthesis B2 protein n=1 Tax=Fredinandcohnia sp. 179-A 10B2 NHS TaxID=3235176 RepID=UPI00399FA4CC
MKFLKSLILFLSSNNRTKTLFIEAYFMLAWARFLKAIPFSKVVPSLGDPMQETSYFKKQDDIKNLKNISNAIHIMSGYTFWESQCLVKAIAGMKMLERRKIESTLYLGTARDENGNMIAHAWLRSGTFYVSGADGMEKFTVVGKFAKRISTTGLQGENNEYQKST